MSRVTEALDYVHRLLTEDEQMQLAQRLYAEALRRNATESDAAKSIQRGLDQAARGEGVPAREAIEGLINDFKKRHAI